VSLIVAPNNGALCGIAHSLREERLGRRRRDRLGGFARRI